MILTRKNEGNEVKKLTESINDHSTEKSNVFGKIENNAKLISRETDFCSFVVSLDSKFKKNWKFQVLLIFWKKWLWL